MELNYFHVPTLQFSEHQSFKLANNFHHVPLYTRDSLASNEIKALGLTLLGQQRFLRPAHMEFWLKSSFF